MRKLFLLALAGTLATLVASSETAARGGRRHRCCSAPCCPVECPPCWYPAGPPDTSASPVSLESQAGRLFTSPLSNRQYRIIATNDRGNFEHDLPEPSPLERPATDGDTFLGKARRAVKLSVSTVAVEAVTGVAEVMQTLASDAAMRTNHVPVIDHGANSVRVEEEKRNVSVDAFLYAAKKEADNDFHLILGDDPEVSDGMYLTAEVSGLPPTGQFQAVLGQSRQQFKSFFGAQAPTSTNYVLFDPPIHVEVTGSLFFDTDHHPGDIGTGRFKPQTTWEIHPVTKIVFESQARR